MKDIIVKASVIDTDLVKALIYCINKYKDELPKELVSKIEEIANCKTFEYDVDYLRAKGLIACSVIADNTTIEKAVSINPILKRITVDGSRYVYFEDCAIISSKGEVIPLGDL